MVHDDGARASGAAGALARIAQVLGVPPESFASPAAAARADGLLADGLAADGLAAEGLRRELPGARALARSAESADLLEAFGHIACPQARRLCLRLIREVAARETRGAA